MNALQGILAVLHDKHGAALIEAMRLYPQRHEIAERAKQ